MKNVLAAAASLASFAATTTSFTMPSATTTPFAGCRSRRFPLADPRSTQETDSASNSFPQQSLSRTDTALGIFSRRKAGNGDSDSSDSDHDVAASESGTDTIDPDVEQTSLLLRRLSWLSWWAQLSLTSISSVILIFARAVLQRANASATPIEAISLPNFFLVGASLILSFLSLFWTWATRRLARRLVRKATTKSQAAAMLRKDITIGVSINLVGMLLTLVGAEQIVGALAVKVLATSSRGISFITADTNSFLQPLDILIVQANTNTLLSHFTSLAMLLYFTRRVSKLDPRKVQLPE